MQQPSSMPYRGRTKRPWTQASETPGTSWQSRILEASVASNVLLSRNASFLKNSLCLDNVHGGCPVLIACQAPSQCLAAVSA